MSENSSVGWTFYSGFGSNTAGLDVFAVLGDGGWVSLKLGSSNFFSATITVTCCLQCDMKSSLAILEEECSCLGYFFFCSALLHFLRGKDNGLLFFFSWRVPHTWVELSSYTAVWEPLVWGYSPSSLAEALLLGTVLLEGVMLQLV